MNKTVYILEEAHSREDDQEAVEMFIEYQQNLGVDLAFQNFDQELKDIKFQYRRPYGLIIIARDQKRKSIGCAGIR